MTHRTRIICIIVFLCQKIFFDSVEDLIGWWRIYATFRKPERLNDKNQYEVIDDEQFNKLIWSIQNYFLSRPTLVELLTSLPFPLVAYDEDGVDGNFHYFSRMFLYNIYFDIVKRIFCNDDEPFA